MRLIDADALMEECAKFVAPSNRSDYISTPTWNDAVSLIDSAPTISPKTGRWIPVSEGLPEPDTRVIVWMAWGGFSMLDYQYGHFYGLNSVNNLPDEAVTAWMPLPEPYKEEVTE